MRAEFIRTQDERQTVVAGVTWEGAGVRIDVGEGQVRDAVTRIFRRSPVVVDDPSLRPAGTAGPVALQPGSLAWFAAVARLRSEEEGLTARLVPGGAGGLGWDPAGTYRGFSEQIERIDRSPEPAGADGFEAGQARQGGERGPAVTGTEAAKPGPRPSGAAYHEPPP
jgi:hypothetical protein